MQSIDQLTIMIDFNSHLLVSSGHSSLDLNFMWSIAAFFQLDSCAVSQKLS